VEDDCLTSVGRVLRDVALIDMAARATATPVTTTNTAVVVLANDCFEMQPTALPVATIVTGVGWPSGSYGLGDELANVDLSVSIPGGKISLVRQQKTRGRFNWLALAQSRLKTLTTSQGPIAVIGPCSAHLP
jgi:hypothetical protein